MEEALVVVDAGLLVVLLDFAAEAGAAEAAACRVVLLSFNCAKPLDRKPPVSIASVLIVVVALDPRTKSGEFAVWLFFVVVLWVADEDNAEKSGVDVDGGEASAKVSDGYGNVAAAVSVVVLLFVDENGLVEKEN